MGKTFTSSIKSNWDAWVLFLFGMSVLISDIFSVVTSLWTRAPISIDLNSLLLALIIIAIAIERFKYINELKSGIDHLRNSIMSVEANSGSIENSLKRVLKCEVIEGAINISSTVDRLLLKTKKQIRTTAFGNTNRDRKYDELLAGILEKGKASGNIIQYQSAYQTGINMDARQNLFREKNIADCAKFLKVEDPLYINILIIDDSHLFIAFAELESETTHRHSIYIHDNPEFIRAMGVWYDNHLWARNEGKLLKPKK